MLPIDPTAFRYDRRQACEPRVEQHDLRCASSRRRSRTHRDTEVGLLQRQHVVDAVADHPDGVAVLLQRGDDGELLVGADPAEDVAVRAHVGVGDGSSSGGRVHSSVRSAPSMPTAAATAPTVVGSSPDSTFNVTPCSANHETVDMTSPRTCSPSATMATGWKRPSGRCSALVARVPTEQQHAPSFRRRARGSVAARYGITSPVRRRHPVHQHVGSAERPTTFADADGRPSLRR